MLSDPQSVTLNSVATSLPKVSTGEFTGVYRKDDGTVQLDVSHTPSGKTKWRRKIGLNTVDISPDPFQPSLNRDIPFKVYLVVEAPTAGISLAAQKDKVQALTTALTASSGALLTKFLGGES
jgi:hypothetical protein